DRNLLNVGLSIGQRDRDVVSITPFPPPLPFVSRVTTSQKIRPLRAYIRDEFRVSDHLALTGELKVQRLSLDSTTLLQIGAAARPPVIIDVEKTKLLPTFIADYRPNAHTGVRLRARRLITGIKDFELLEPHDLFLFSLRD